MAQNTIKKESGIKKSGQHSLNANEIPQPKLSNGHSTSIDFLSSQSETLKSLPSEISALNLGVQDVSENDFLSYVEMALDLGLDAEVNTLLSDTNLAELSPLFDAILDKMHQKINLKFESEKAEKVTALIKALNKDGHALSIDQYLELERALSPFFLSDPILTFSTNDEYGEVPPHLAISQNEIEMTLIDEYQDEELARYIYTSISKVSAVGMIMTDEDVLELNSDICTIEEYLGINFKDKFSSRDEILDKAIELNAHADIGMEEDEFREVYETTIDALLSTSFNNELLEKTEPKKINDSQTYQWFKKETNQISVKNFNDFLECTGHYPNLQFIISDINASELLEAESGGFYELPDNQNLIKLNNSIDSIIDFLVNSAMVRYLFNIYTILATSGKPKSIWSHDAIRRHSLDKFQSYPCIL